MRSTLVVGGDSGFGIGFVHGRTLAQTIVFKAIDVNALLGLSVLHYGYIHCGLHLEFDAGNHTYGQ